MTQIKKICPKPDCDSYLEKSNITKYVKCENGHEFCFECLNRPHGNILCDKYIEEEFMDWKKGKRVKRCPRCKIYTEKNEGCNHMTCTSCKYQWCWLCEGEYKYGHYDSGGCKGFQFTKADNLEEAKKIGRDSLSLLDDEEDDYNPYHFHIDNPPLNLPTINCCITLHSFFPCFFEEVRYIHLFGYCERYLCIFLMWFIGVFGFSYISMDNYLDNNDIDINECFMYLISACLFVCYQIMFTCLITPFILISLLYPRFIDRIFKFLEMNI